MVSIHAPLARSNRANRRCSRGNMVSIHAPLARSNGSLRQGGQLLRVSIHAPLARSNCVVFPACCHFNRFNTCSSCEEQLRILRKHVGFPRFNTCSSCEEQLQLEEKDKKIAVSIHAPLARSNMVFPVCPVVDDPVSIHAPLARSNLRIFLPRSSPPSCFNTCSSCEEQHTCTAHVFRVECVSIHAPLARSNNRFSAIDAINTLVSIHAPLARSNLIAFSGLPSPLMFQYMLLLRGATCVFALVVCYRPRSFNTCSSCEEQPKDMPIFRSARSFNTCSSCEEQRSSDAFLPARQVSIHAPLARSN